MTTRSSATVSSLITTDRMVVEDRESGVFRVSRRAFSDPRIMQLEREHIFDTCWVYVGHESEIREPGSFVTREVVGRKIIFARDKDNRPRAFFNTCPHRGAEVCREAKGKTKLFRCIYHAWAFDTSGSLVARPNEEDYSDACRDPERYRLAEPAHFDSYRGFCFMNLDPNAVGLEEYLADAKMILDFVSDQSDVGMEVVGGTQEYGFRANWKLLCENSIDGYHGYPVHATYFDYLLSTNGNFDDAKSQINRALDLGNGHAVIEYGAPWGRPVAQAVPSWGEEGRRDVEQIMDRLVKRLGRETAERIAHNNRNTIIFPNLVINDIMAITIRTFYPVAPGRLRVNAWALAPKEETPIMRERRLFNFLEFLGPGGFATPDDAEALEACQRGYENSDIDGLGWNDISKGALSDHPMNHDEEQMRCFWREWSRRMEGGIV